MPFFSLCKVVAIDAHQYIKQDDQRNTGKAEQDQQASTDHQKDITGTVASPGKGSELESE